MSLQRLSQVGQGNTTPVGSMNRRITIQSSTISSYGQLAGVWTDVVSTWAKVENLTGKEVANAAEFAAEITHRLTIPYMHGIDPRMRVEMTWPGGKTRYFDILFVQNVEERSFFVELLAQEIFSTT